MDPLTAPPAKTPPELETSTRARIGAPPPHRPAAIARHRRSLRRRVARFALKSVGWLLIAIGAVGSVLPGHLGLPLLVAGLIIVLRGSVQARRQFVGLQRKHPKIMFPIRRLLRREPKVLLVAWQELLHLERMILPRRWRVARRLRLWFRRWRHRRRARRRSRARGRLRI